MAASEGRPRAAEAPLGTPFAAVLRRCRTELGSSQREFGALFGVETQTISKWERGIAHPQPRFNAALVEVLRLSGLDELRSLLRRPEDSSRDDAGGSADVIDMVTRSGGPARLVADEVEPRQPSEADPAVPDDLMAAALKMIHARDGRLNAVEAEIVRSLVTRSRSRTGP